MIWLEATATMMAAAAYFFNRNVVVRALAIIIICDGLAVMAVDASSESTNVDSRILAFGCIFAGIALSSLTILTKTERLEGDLD